VNVSVVAEAEPRVIVRETIERDRFPMSPRIRSFKAAKLDPPFAATGAIASTEATGRAQHGAGEEAPAVELVPAVSSGLGD